MGIRDRPISPQSPWQNGYAERLIGTLRRECLDQMIIFGETHLRRILSAYAAYYNQARTHLALRCPLASSSPTVWCYYRHSDLSWTASPLRPDMIFGKDNSSAVIPKADIPKDQCLPLTLADIWLSNPRFRTAEVGDFNAPTGVDIRIRL
jgi:hypothetical protein